jgi:hypothetical protein
VAALGDLRAAFDFTQRPRPPLLLPAHPVPGPAPGPLTIGLRVLNAKQLVAHHGRALLRIRCLEVCALRTIVRLVHDDSPVPIARISFPVTVVPRRIALVVTVPPAELRVLRAGVAAGRHYQLRILIDGAGPAGAHAQVSRRVVAAP